MSIATSFRKSLGAKISLKLAVLLLLLTAGAAAVITVHETRQMEQITLEKAQLAATLGARQYGDVLESAIDNGLVTVNDVFDKTYTEIKGYNWGNTPKYHTKYDAVTDRGVLIFQDKYLDQEDFVFAVGNDGNGYVPTHNIKFQKPITGVPEKDLTGNRTKRIFDDPVGTAAVHSLEPVLLQVYKRDTGETMWDVSSPIYVKGKHWGAFRIGVSMERIAGRQRQLLLTLLAIFGGFAAITVFAMFVLVRQAMAPVVAVTGAAQEISLGERLDQPIRADSIDEIGQLTKAIDRLRVSMKAAMERLGQ